MKFYLQMNECNKHCLEKIFSILKEFNFEKKANRNLFLGQNTQQANNDDKYVRGKEIPEIQTTTKNKCTKNFHFKMYL